MDETWIYALVDPRDSRVRYVGKADDPHKRFLMHMREAAKVQGRTHWFKTSAISPKLVWLDSLIQQGEQPILVTLEKCKRSEWREIENKWIFELEAAGANLTNVRTISGYPNLHNDLYFPPREEQPPAKILGRFKIVRKQD